MRLLLKTILPFLLFFALAVACLAQLPSTDLRFTPAPTCVKATVDRTALTAAAATQDVTLFTLPERGKLSGVTTKHSAAFAGTNIGADTFTGTGLDDATIGGTFSGASALNYRIEIDGATPDTFKWSDDGGSTWDATMVAITGAAQTLNNGVTVTFGATTGHTATDRWDFATTVLSAMTASVGTSGAATAYSAAFNVFQAPGTTVFLDSAAVAGHKSADMAAHAAIARFTATGQNLGNATTTFLSAGSADFWACYVILP